MPSDYIKGLLLKEQCETLTQREKTALYNYRYRQTGWGKAVRSRCQETYADTYHPLTISVPKAYIPEIEQLIGATLSADRITNFLLKLINKNS